jgi:hypothetical protein
MGDWEYFGTDAMVIIYNIGRCCPPQLHCRSRLKFSKPTTMAYNEKTGDSPIVAVPADTRSSGSIHDVHEEKAAGAHVLDVEVANITGDIPLHPHPRGPNDGFDDLKEELESKIEVIDWYKPFPLVPGAREETSILTFRAIIVGIILGSLTICSNVYLGKVFPSQALTAASNNP